jgi:tetratricopeptide (TPR) repeat protein
VQRAAQVRRQFVLDGQAHSVARICRLVEGLPLAIELAAAALRTHSCTAIADAIESSLSTLASGLRAIPERHRSIWATFEHSWRLLSDEERQVFPRLAVFRGGFEKEAAIQVAQASPQLLASLADKSLLRWDGAARYDLHELVRQYAFDKLQEAGERVQTQDRHLVYFLELVEQADAELTSPRRRIRLEQLDAEYNNLRAALEYCKVQGYGELWLRLAAVLWLYWEASGLLHEGLGWLEDALAGASGDAQVEASVVPDRRAIARVHAAAAPRAHALIGAAQLARHYGDCARAAAWAEESLALCREQEDLWGTAASLNILGRAERDRGDYARAERLLEENLRIYRALNDAEGIAYTLMSLSYVVDHGGDHARAVAMNEESLSLSRARGDRRGSAWALQFLGNSARSLGSYARATELLEESLALFQEQRVKPGIAQVLTNLGLVARDQGDYPAACRRFEQSLGLWREMGIWQDIVRLLELLETTTRNQGDDTAAHAFYRERVELMEMPSPTS